MVDGRAGKELGYFATTAFSILIHVVINGFFGADDVSPCVDVDLPANYRGQGGSATGGRAEREGRRDGGVSRRGAGGSVSNYAEHSRPRSTKDVCGVRCFPTMSIHRRYFFKT